MKRIGGYLAVSTGIGMVTGIASQNIPEGLGYGMAGGFMLTILLKRLFNR
jgi:hypothetical protein